MTKEKASGLSNLLGRGKHLIKDNKGKSITIAIVVVVFVIISITVNGFFTIGNIMNVLTQASTIGLMGMGLTFVIITAGIDLSLPTTMALSGIMGCSVMVKTQNIFLGIVVMILVGALVGLINGFSVSKLKMVPMIVTLAIATINSGISNWFTGAKSIAGMPSAFAKIFAGKVLGIPVSVIVLILVGIVMHCVLEKTIFGRQLFQVGVNVNTAKVNGINTERILMLIYVISGAMAGIAAILSSSILNAAGPTMGPQSLFIDVVAGVVLGGASVMGGRGKISGTIMGCVLIAIISNVMNLLSIHFFVSYIIKGAIIVIIAYLDVRRNKVAERRG